MRSSASRRSPTATTLIRSARNTDWARMIGFQGIALAAQGQVEPDLVAKAIDEYGIDPDGVDPYHV